MQHIETRMTTFKKSQLKKSNGQINIDKYRVTAHYINTTNIMRAKNRVITSFGKKEI